MFCLKIYNSIYVGFLVGYQKVINVTPVCCVDSIILQNVTDTGISDRDVTATFSTILQSIGGCCTVLHAEATNDVKNGVQC
jgi:hypothetical protein